MVELIFATGNANKWAEVQSILNRPLLRANIDLPELQGGIEEIAKEKCRMAVERLGKAVITEDTALCFDALKGELPGPYIKWFLEGLGHEGLTRLLAGWEDKGARAICTVVLCEGPGAEPVVFQGVTSGKIVPPRGPPKFGWDPIFQPDHPSGLTYAEMDSGMKNSISHRYKAFSLLRQYLEDK